VARATARDSAARRRRDSRRDAGGPPCVSPTCAPRFCGAPKASPESRSAETENDAEAKRTAGVPPADVAAPALSEAECVPRRHLGGRVARATARDSAARRRRDSRRDAGGPPCVSPTCAHAFAGRPKPAREQRNPATESKRDRAPDTARPPQRAMRPPALPSRDPRSCAPPSGSGRGLVPTGAAARSLP